MSSERRSGWGGAEEGQALWGQAPRKCGCLGLDDYEAGRGGSDVRSLQVSCRKCAVRLHLMWHGDAQCRDCRVGLTDGCQSYQNASDTAMAMPLSLFSSLRMESLMPTLLYSLV